MQSFCPRRPPRGGVSRNLSLICGAASMGGRPPCGGVSRNNKAGSKANGMTLVAPPRGGVSRNLNSLGGLGGMLLVAPMRGRE